MKLNSFPKLTRSQQTVVLLALSLLSLAVLLTHTRWPAATVEARSYVAPAIATTCNDVWATMTTTGAPAGRFLHQAVWTGTEMIVWGGQGNGPHPDFPNTGGRYNPATNTWTPTSTTNAPVGRRWFTAVWTGTEMIVWGGQDSSFTDTNTGGRYNPATNTWTPTSTLGAPSGREHHSAIWTGTEMIVWGGQGSSGAGHTGGRYNPATDTWTPTTTTNVAPGRIVHTAVWTGTEMIVWGGFGGSGHLNTGGRYNPATDSWIATSTTNAPAGREQHTAVWTGNEMIIWGGLSPSGRFNTGGRYNPATDSWIATNTTNAPSARQQQTAIWTGMEMIVWGGFDNSFSLVNTGARYNPMADSWTTMSASGAPTGRSLHTAIWTNSEMIVWGGQGNPNLNTGGRYCGGTPNTAPIAKCQNVTVSAGPICATEASIDNGSSDPDGDPLSLTQSPAGPYPVGMTNVMLTVTDGNGGSSSCSATVTVVDNTLPAITPPPNFSKPMFPGLCSAPVLLRRPIVSDNCGIASVTNNAPAGNIFPIGTTTVTWTVTDVNGNSNTALQTVTWIDLEPPTITLTGQPIALWPPNHQYETINVSQLVAGASDNCGGDLTASVVIAQVSSDEPEDAPGGGDGHTLNDIVIAADCKSVQLRAERQGDGNGRVYTITFRVRDAAGNLAMAAAKVTVPKSQSGAAAVDDGSSYIVLGSCP